MGTMSVSSCRCCMFVSCVYHVAVTNAALCMTCSLLILFEDARGDHLEEAYFRASPITALQVAMSLSFCLPHLVVFIICSGVCACTDMLLVCVLYVSFGSKVLPIIFGCVAMCNTVLLICRSRLFLHSVGSGVNRVQVVLPGFIVKLLCFVQAKTLCRYGCMYF